jgi:hypothetical protein
MRPPTVYPQLWPYHFIWKEILRKWFFSSNIIKPPRRWSIEKRKKERENVLKKENKKKEEEKKAPRVSSNKGEVNILRREKHFNFKIYFLMWFHFLPPPIIPFQKPLPKPFRKFS